jgi:hypothetical protein
MPEKRTAGAGQNRRTGPVREGRLEALPPLAILYNFTYLIDIFLSVSSLQADPVGGEGRLPAACRG